MPAIRQNKKKSTLPIVVKVGGSLFHQIRSLAPVFKNSECPLLLIPGGGPFADTVRRYNINNDSAHWMAVAAMEQFGWYISSHGILPTAEMAVPSVTTFFLPYRYFLSHDGLPHTWDVTSDTMAAWVAACLHLDLLLLKSVDGIFVNGIFQKQITGPVESAVIDPMLIPFVINNSIKTTIISGLQPDRVEKYLKGKIVARSEICTTF